MYNTKQNIPQTPFMGAIGIGSPTLTAEAPRKIPEQLAALAASLDEFERVVAKLEARLAPIIEMHPQEACGCDAAPLSNGIYGELMSGNARLRDLMGRVMAMEQHCQL